MRKRELTQALRGAFDAPAAEGKRAFLRALPPQRVSMIAFIRAQARYIRKWVWAASALVFCLAVGAAVYTPPDALWTAGALVPFAALAAVTEGTRSAVYAMEELELATRFSLKSVVLARMSLLGLVHGLLLGLLTPFGGVGLLRTGVYLLTPYLLTSLLSLAAARRVRGREAIYVCGAMAVLVSGLSAALHASFHDLYAAGNFRWWLAALAACIALTGCEYSKIIKKSEELSWSL